MAFDRFARVELDRFFCRREERGKFYCSACLVEQLTERGSRRIRAAFWTAAIEEAFVHPGLLQVRGGRPCEVCKTRDLSIGAESLESEVSGQLSRLIQQPLKMP